MMKPLFYLLVICISTACPAQNEKQVQYNNALLQKIRNAGMSVADSLPTSVGYIKFAESRRKCSDLLDGETDDTCIMARTAFQIVYSDGWVMMDAGMDRAVHKFFERNGPQPFDDAKAAIVAKAVEGAKLIVVTHEHGDHVAGAVRAPSPSVRGKTILTRQQADGLINNPQMPEIKLSQDAVSQYRVVEFDDIYRAAPGVVLVKAPGHTKGEIMVFTRLGNGKEYLFVGDVTWTHKGAAEMKQKPESERKRLNEDGEKIAGQLDWINHLMTKENVTVLVSHDNIMLPQYAKQGLITDGFKKN
jgi:glyoxylase-like metal-dependent hydrolase (beta-lactamase superfamily II)